MYCIHLYLDADPRNMFQGNPVGLGTGICIPIQSNYCSDTSMMGQYATANPLQFQQI